MSMSVALTPSVSGTTIVTAASKLWTKSRRNWSPTWCAEAVVGSTRSSGNPQRTPKNGAPSNNSNATPASPSGIALRITQLRRSVPEPLLDGDWFRLGATEHSADKSAHVERIEAVAEQDQSGGCDHDRSGRGEADRRDAGVSERLQEVHREKHHHGHRQRNRCGRERHGATRRHHRPDQGVVAARAFSQLVAEPADHQQRVVDSQRQAQRGGEVEREDRHVGGKRDPPQHRECAEDRHHADSYRQRGGHQSAERPDQHEKTQRDRQRLHHHQVALRLFGELDVDHRGATRPHGDAVVVAGHLVGQLVGQFLLLTLVAVDARHDEAGRAVAADQIRGRGGRRGPW